MIRRLVVLQFRSGWRATVSTAATVALAVAFGTFALLLAATQIANQAADPRNAAAHYGHSAEFVSAFGDPSSVAEWPESLSLDEVAALVRSAAQEGPVTAFSGTYGRVNGADAWVDITVPLEGFDPDRYLSRGSFPQTGEIAISATLAASLDLSIGDTITLTSDDPRVPTTAASLTLSGILRDGAVGPYWTWTPGGIACWEDLEYLSSVLPEGFAEMEDTGSTVSLVSTYVSWSGDNPALSRYEQFDYEPYDWRFRWSDAFANLAGPAGWALLLAGLTVACLIAAALGMGRSRAEARARWAGTARVLGATRGTIAAASIVETFVVSVAGAGLGLGVGALAAHVHLAYLRSANPDGLLPSAISVPAVVVGAGLALGAALAVILAVVPAFWASRVAPVAALKHVTPIREATLSRVVNPWWPFAIMAGGLVTSVTLLRLNVNGSLGSLGDLGAGLAQIAWFIAGAAVVVQIARGLVAGMGCWLARARVPWVLAAGDGLLSHRRSFTFAALTATVLAALLAGAATMSTFSALAWSVDDREWDEVRHVPFTEWWREWFSAPGVPAFASVAFAVIAIMAVTVRASSRASTAQEDATRSALGLSHRGARAAVALRDTAVMAAGTVVGALAGWAVVLAWRVGGAAIFPYDRVYSFQWNATSALYGLAATGAIIGIGLAASLVTGLLVSRLAAAAPPVAAIGRSDA